ncbi:MAG: hypothetical protein WA821_11630 [Anaerolineales bacterium]
MAKVRQNIVVQGLSGSLGDQLVIKQDKAGRTIVSIKAAYSPNREFSDLQKSHQDSFREAAAYGQSAQGNPVYAQKAEGTPMSAYNVAMADWFHAPEILDVDLSAWSGGAGQAIRVKAMDDVQVKQVTVVITDEKDAVLEQGAATQADNLWWQYTTTAAAGGSPKVLVSAQDLPGHIAEMTKVK